MVMCDPRCEAVPPHQVDELLTAELAKLSPEAANLLFEEAGARAKSAREVRECKR